MATFDARYVVKLGMEEIDPDGEACRICGDPIYLEAFQAFVKNAHDGTRIGEAGPFCGSCVETVKENILGNPGFQIEGDEPE